MNKYTLRGWSAAWAIVFVSLAISGTLSWLMIVGFVLNALAFYTTYKS